ncbi:MAG: P-loop NTPase fold protein [Fervidobacterium sp.]
MSLEKLVGLLTDKPLDQNDAKLLVNRQKEFQLVDLILNYQNYGIFGISGEPGIGKTTFINNIATKLYTIKIALTQRDNQDTILYDLLYNLAVQTQNDLEISKKVKDWLVEEISYIKGLCLGISFIANADLSFQKQNSPRFNYFKAKEYFNSIIKELIDKHGKIILVIDELDKESKKDVLLVLDNLKSELQKESIITLISLPYKIYKEYKMDKLQKLGEGNLDNVLKDIINLREFTNSEVKEIILRRLNNYVHLFENGALEIIADYSDGNPRDALWIAQKIVFEAMAENLERITHTYAKQSIKKITRQYVAEISLTDKQKSMIDERLFPGTKDEIIKKAVSTKNLHRSTAYSIFERLLQLGIIVERNGTYKLSGKNKFLYIDS